MNLEDLQNEIASENYEEDAIADEEAENHIDQAKKTSKKKKPVKAASKKTMAKKTPAKKTPAKKTPAKKTPAKNTKSAKPMPVVKNKVAPSVTKRKASPSSKGETNDVGAMEVDLSPSLTLQ